MLWCVLASIALHALVLLGFSRREALAPPARTQFTLTASLRPVAIAPRGQPSQSPPQPLQSWPPPRPQLQSQPVPPPVLRSALTQTPPPVLNKPATRTAQARGKAAPAEAAKSALGVAAKTLPPEPAASAAAAASSAPPAAPIPVRSAAQAPAGVNNEPSGESDSEVDKGTLEQYRLALIVATRRYKRYPAIAMEKGWQGRVEVHMVIGANGMLARASIKTSSGHEILDNQAVNMLKKGKTTVRIPASLRGREFGIDIPVIFNLDSPNS